MTWEQMERAIESLTEQGAKQDGRIASLIDAINQDAENIRSLARIAEAHEHRIDRLEDGQ